MGCGHVPPFLASGTEALSKEGGAVTSGQGSDHTRHGANTHPARLLSEASHLGSCWARGYSVGGPVAEQPP